MTFVARMKVNVNTLKTFPFYIFIACSVLV